jgi:outer membrane protein assembly factor BamB
MGAAPSRAILDTAALAGVVRRSEELPGSPGPAARLAAILSALLLVPSIGCSSNTLGDGGGARDGASQTCTPGETRCHDGANLDQCRPDGTGWETTLCGDGVCLDGQCACNPGAARCDNGNAETCGPDHQYHASPCPTGTACRDGLCDDLRCDSETMSSGHFSLPVEGWPRFRHDNRNSGWTPVLVADHPALLWKVKIGGTSLNGSLGGLASGPVIDQNGRVLQGGGELDGKGGALYALDATGQQLWVFDGPRGYGWTTPAVRTDGVSYYSTADGTAYAVGLDGAQSWSFKLGAQDDCTPIVTKDGYIIYGTDAGSLFAMRPDGTLLWTADVSQGPGEVDAALAESCDGLIYGAGMNGWAGMDAQTGATKWRVPATGPYGALISSPVVTYDGTMYGLDSGGVLYAIDQNGNVLWQKTVSTPFGASDVAHVADKIFAVLNDGALHAYKASDGTELWAQPVGNQREVYKHPGPVVDGNQRLYFNSNDGNVYAFDTTGKQLWKVAASGVATPPQMQGSGYYGAYYGTIAIDKGGRLFVPGNDGYLYAFQ